MRVSRISFTTLLSIWIGQYSSSAWMANPSFQGSRLQKQQQQLQPQQQLWATGGADIDVEDDDSSPSVTGVATAEPPVTASADLPPSTTPDTTAVKANIPLSAAALAARGKVNEIDFCIAPADVSLSRAYGAAAAAASPTTAASGVESLTRALNNASNRAVRRILLARSWPSAEALNLSLRQVAMAEKEREQQQQQQQQQQATTAATGASSTQQSSSSSTAKCPVPRPILNVLTRQGASTPSDNSSTTPPENRSRRPVPRSRTDEEYVADQIQSFREKYGSLPGYAAAEDYLASILSLATSGVESERAAKVLESDLYDEAYKRVLAVLRTVGAQFVVDESTGRQRIASKLLNQDICLSMLDKISIKKEGSISSTDNNNNNNNNNNSGENGAAAKVLQQKETASVKESDKTEASEVDDQKKKKKKRSFKFWKKEELNGDATGADDDSSSNENVELTGDDLGGVLLSAKEPTVTRQLNALSNIVQRALLFGGDQELLVLAETLDADRKAFIDRWYPDTSSEDYENTQDRPGLRYLDCLVLLLRKCYTDGVVTDLNPPLSLSNSYANAYERLVASLVELGSGYMKPVVGTTPVPSNLPKPRTAQEGIGQFAIWESSARKAASSSVSDEMRSAYPSDMEGTWEVTDEIGGKTIGSSTVKLLENGNVQVVPPLEGLRWRLDPGPTHLDTLTFQVLSSDGTVLQYRGFIDRGARLEARFSKRPTKVRGSVMFQMRDGTMTVDYYRDMLPINYRQGTTKFVMTKQITK